MHTSIGDTTARATVGESVSDAHPTRVVGLMSGTSHDAVDAVAVDITAHGDELIVDYLGMISREYSPALRELIIDSLPPGSVNMASVCELDTRIGQAFADVARLAISELCEGRADLIASHGQTMFHWVADGVVHGSLQLGQPAWIAECTGTTVVTDFRARDIAAGGQGAPLVSIVDALWLAGTSAVAVNLGGIANITKIDQGKPPVAFDTGPANALIDAAMTEFTDGRESFDRDGQHALRGAIDRRLLSDLLDEPYYARPAPKTTGKELFHIDYLRRFLAGAKEISLDDLVATLVELTAQTVAGAARGSNNVLLSGGGAKNPALVESIRAALPDAVVQTTDEWGLPSDAKEGLAFATLGYLTWNGQAGTVPSCTGAGRARVLGSVVPGDAVPARRLFSSPTRLFVNQHDASKTTEGEEANE